jgi:hypothetical protein
VQWQSVSWSLDNPCWPETLPRFSYGFNNASSFGVNGTLFRGIIEPRLAAMRGYHGSAPIPET